MPSYLHNTINVKKTKQTSPIPGKQQVKNAAGGYGFEITAQQQLLRWLILGSEGGTYYVQQKALTTSNIGALQRAVEADGLATVKLIADVSSSGRAPKNTQALFALAYCMTAKSEVTRLAAYDAVSTVARTGTHLFELVGYIDTMRGWGRAVRRAVGSWYADKTPDKLAYQLVKYRQRNGWTHRDVLRLAHPSGKQMTSEHNALLRWAVGKEGEVDDESTSLSALQHPLIAAFEMAQQADEPTTFKLIQEHGLTHEMVQTQHLKSPDIWQALLEKMPMTAMVRNLGRMSSIGLVAPMSDAARTVTDRLHDDAFVRRSRIHPIQLLVAMQTYAQGHGSKGNLTWTIVPQVCDALEDAFYASFANVEPTGKRWYLGVDISGSMGWGTIAGVDNLTPARAAAAMAMVTARTEDNYFIGGFAQTFREIGISRNTRLDDAVRKCGEMAMGGTDAAVPIKHALTNKVPVDVFAVYSDGETWAGDEHVCQALKRYRDATGIPAKLINVAFVSSSYSPADVSDPLTLETVGFDTQVPQLMAEFVRGF